MGSLRETLLESSHMFNPLEADLNTVRPELLTADHIIFLLMCSSHSPHVLFYSVIMIFTVFFALLNLLFHFLFCVSFAGYNDLKSQVLVLIGSHSHTYHRYQINNDHL